MSLSSAHADQEEAETAAAKAAMRQKLLGIAADISTAGRRQQMAADVFKPSHTLPTISVEQAGALELQQVRCCAKLPLATFHS